MGTAAGSYSEDTTEADHSLFAGSYCLGDAVEYYVEAHQAWFPAYVTDVDSAGKIMISRKPGNWIPTEVQAVGVRPSPFSTRTARTTRRNLIESGTNLAA